jgi:hypothetical protein
VLDEDVLHIVTGPEEVFIGVAVPVALHGKHIVGRAQKGVTDDGVASAEPVHSILVGVAGVAADDAEIVIDESRRSPSSGSTRFLNARCR